jgi:very-short-patch-repair endonuclease
MVTPAQVEIDRLLSVRRAVARRQHPELARALLFLVESGRLVSALPGVYVRSEDARDPLVRARALVLSDPGAVLTHRAAACWSFWPDIRMDLVDAALASRRRAPAGFRFQRRRIPPELVRYRDGAHFTDPALTALDLVPDVGEDGIDRALRLGVASLAGLRHALELSPHRAGNPQRRTALLDSRDQPWSRSERLLHRLLRDAGVGGWQTNVEVRLADGTFFLDVAFVAQQVGVEVDGWEFHARQPRDFDATLRRHSILESAGWRVLHFTWSHLVDDPAWVLERIVQTVERENRPLTVGTGGLWSAGPGRLR